MVPWLDVFVPLLLAEEGHGGPPCSPPEGSQPASAPSSARWALPVGEDVTGQSSQTLSGEYLNFMLYF